MANDRPGPKIVCTGVSLVMGNNAVLKDITLTIEPGTIHCIIGPNGGGKSSFVSALLGRTRHTGSIAMQWAEGDKTIGYVPQTIAVDSALPLTVRDFLTLCVHNRPRGPEASKRLGKMIDTILSSVKMAGKERNLFSELSGGERQRVLFAQALLPTPRLLIMDEPTSGIDAAGETILSEMVHGLAEQGSTVLWVHHDLVRVRQMAHTVSCINRRLVFSGTPAEVMNETRLFELFSDSNGT